MRAGFMFVFLIEMLENIVYLLEEKNYLNILSIQRNQKMFTHFLSEINFVNFPQKNKGANAGGAAGFF